MQTTNIYKIPTIVTDIVWNSKVAMNNNLRKLKHSARNHYIPHGFSPDEFRPLNIDRKNDVMIIASDFIERSKFMNYKLWYDMSKDCNNLSFDVWGHQRAFSGNRNNEYSRALSEINLSDEDIDKEIRQSVSLENLIKTYNSYKLYFNTTSHSALPRGRAEAMMCGTPIVTTNNYDISDYLVNQKDCILSNDFNVLKKGILDIVNDKDVRKYYSEAARAAAIKFFHIDDYIKRWREVVEK